MGDMADYLTNMFFDGHCDCDEMCDCNYDYNGEQDRQKARLENQFGELPDTE